MKRMEELKDMLCDELEDITAQGKINAGDLDAIDKLTHSIKSIDTIMAMDEYSNDDGYMMSRNSYARGDGRGGARGGNRGGRGYSRRGYSRNGYSYGKEEMIGELQDLMEAAETDQEREAIRRCIGQMR